MTIWTLVLYLHLIGAALWVGGQLTVSLVLLPLVRRVLPIEQRGVLIRTVGRRFAALTIAGFLPVQLATGVALAAHHGVGWSDLAAPGYGRVLAAKLALFAAVMAASAVHGWAAGQGRTDVSRGAAVFALVGSLGVVLLAAALRSSG